MSLLMIGELSLKLGVQEHVIRALANRGAIPFERTRRYRLFAVKDLPKIKAAIKKAGYATH